jgi:cytochrome c553
MHTLVRKLRISPALSAGPGFLVVLALSIASNASADESAGQQIFRKQCASCHGQDGVGTDDGSPLEGERSLEELTKVVAETMPEDDPESCVGEDAEQVAAYLYEAFYGEAARARRMRPRLQLARLTVRQYRHAAADLVASFDSDRGRWDDKRGLRAEYYNSRRPRRNKREIERVDATVDFDFGDKSPGDMIGVEEFSASWEGAVLAAEDGLYEFNLVTENAGRLWVNDREKPLIDAWVRSGDETDHRGRIYLLGGRVYPIKLEYFKYKEKTASVALCWTPPGQAEQVIPERLLSPNRFAETLIVETPFPPDDRSYGFERATSISPQWDEATTYAALEVAGKLASDLKDFPGYREGATDNEPRLRLYCREFVEQAFRRSLTEEQAQVYVDRQFNEAKDLSTAVKRVILLTLKSPRFLYREVGTAEDDQFDVAARLSFGLWDSLPDDELLEAAGRGELKTREQVVAQSNRMVEDLRARAKVREFFHHWLAVEHFADVSKDEQSYPEFNDQVLSDLRTSLDLFLDDVVWSDVSDFRQLLLADSLYLNGRLAAVYGADLPPDAAFQKVATKKEDRAGVLTHPLLLTGFSYHATTSPIHRGVFIARNVLGRVLRPPPEAVTPLPPESHVDLTTRERTLLQTKPAGCQTCHRMINPLGFPLESFDALGRYRSEENGKPIDASGSYQTLAGDKVEFDGPRELAKFLVDSPEVHDAFVEQVFHHFVKQSIRAHGDGVPEQLRRSFTDNKFNIRRLIVESVTVSALYGGNNP